MPSLTSYPDTYTPTHLTGCHYSSPQITYTNLMQSSTKLYPFRQPYVPLRMVNDVYGKYINRQITDGYNKINQFKNRKDLRDYEDLKSMRKNNVNRLCDGIYL